MHRVIPVVLIFVLFSQKICAQTFRIEDSQGKALQAWLYFSKSKIQKTADENGIIILENTSSILSSDTVNIQLLGYESKSYIWDNIKYQQLIHIVLTPTIKFLEEVVFQSNGEESFKAPIRVQKIDQKNIRMLSSGYLGSMVNFMSSCRLETNCQTCNYSQLRMLGLGGAYNQILIDGKPIYGGMNTLYGLDLISTSIIDKIEIVKGAGGSVFSPSAIAGTLNITLKKPSKPSFQLEQQLRSYSNKGLEYQSLIESDLILHPNFSVGVQTQLRSREGVDMNADGFTEIPKLFTQSMATNALWTPTSKSKIHFQSMYVQDYRRGGDQIYLRPELSEQAEERHHELKGWGVQWGQQWSKNCFTSLFSSGMNTERVHYTGFYLSEGFGNTSQKTGIVGIQNNWNIHALGAETLLSLGYDYQWDHTQDRIPAYNWNVDQSYFLTGGYLKAEIQGSNLWRSTFSARLNQTSHTNSLKPILQAGISLLPHSNWTIRSSVSNGFRAPLRVDTDLHIAFAGGSLQKIIPDSEWKEENSISTFFSTQFQKSNESIFINTCIEGFYTNIYGPFVLVSSNEEGVLIRENGPNAKVYGVNLEGNFAYNEILQIESSISVQKAYYQTPLQWAEQLEGTKNFMRTPSMYGYTKVLFEPSLKHRIAVTLQLTGSMLVPHFTENGPLLKNTESFYDLSILWGRTLFFKTFSIPVSINIENILNAYQKDFDKGVSRDSNYIYGPSRPRTYQIKVAWVPTF